MRQNHELFAGEAKETLLVNPSVAKSCFGIAGTPECLPSPRCLKRYLPDLDALMKFLSRYALVLALQLRPAAAFSDDLQPLLGTKGPLLLEERFDAPGLPNGWNIKNGNVRVTDGTLHASQNKEAGRLCLFNCEQSMQDAAIQIDFKFEGARGINVSASPSPGQIKKRGHLYSVMITPAMWRITEHNDKADRESQSKTLASRAEKFETGRWYRLLLETKGDAIVAQIQGKQPLRASSPDFHVKKPGLEFRVIGPTDAEVWFDNLQVWALKESSSQ